MLETSIKVGGKNDLYNEDTDTYAEYENPTETQNHNPFTLMDDSFTGILTDRTSDVKEED